MANVFDTVEESIKQYNRLRRDIGASTAVLDDPLAEEYFAESLERYPVDTSKMIAYTRVIALRGIRASAALLGKYAQNQSTEDLTKVFDNLTKMLEEAVAEVALVSDPISTDQVPFFFGSAQGSRGQ
jgi:hypothetical protein